jgi:polyisoprenoid-binding protein YceI
MKKLLFAFTAFIALAATTQPALWKSDKAHSQLGFTVTHLGISDVSGTFNDFDVSIRATKEDFSDAAIEMTAKVASIDTRVEARDNHLKSADFFDAEKHPEIKFKSTSLKKNGKNRFSLTGDLTIHGVTKKVTMDLIYRGSTLNPMSKAKTVGFQLKGTIDRRDFNIGAGFPPPMISNQVRILADGEFVQ